VHSAEQAFSGRHGAAGYHARIPPAGVLDLRSCPHAQSACPTPVLPPAAVTSSPTHRCWGGDAEQVGNVVYASVSCENGRSKGCGLVQFETVAEADAAIDMLNGVEFMGRTIQVREDVKNAKGPKRSRGAGLQTGSVLPKRRFEQDADGGGGDERHRLFISNLSFNTDWMMLKDHFKQVRESVPWQTRAALARGDTASKMILSWHRNPQKRLFKPVVFHAVAIRLHLFNRARRRSLHPSRGASHASSESVSSVCGLALPAWLARGAHWAGGCDVNSRTDRSRVVRARAAGRPADVARHGRGGV
jgi:hypothetical protein